MPSKEERSEVKRTIEDVLKMYEPENRERLRRLARKTITAYKVLCYINGEGPFSSNAACEPMSLMRKFIIKYNFQKTTFPRSKKSRLFCVLNIDQARRFKQVVEETANPLIGTCRTVIHRCVAHNPVLIETRAAISHDFKLFWERFYFDNYPRGEYDSYKHIENLPSGRDYWNLKMKKPIYSRRAPEGTLVATAITLFDEIDVEGVPT